MKQTEFNLDVIDVNTETFELEIIDHKTLYNTDYHKPANEWVREEIKKFKTFDAPQMSSSVEVKQIGKCPWCRKKVVILESRLNTRLKIDKEVRQDLEYERIKQN